MPGHFTNLLNGYHDDDQDYKRHGITDVLASMNVATGQSTLGVLTFLKFIDVHAPDWRVT